MSTKKKTAAEAAKETAFTKEALLNCRRFRDERDLVYALLNDDMEYTISEVDDMIAEYLKGEVK